MWFFVKNPAAARPPIMLGSAVGAQQEEGSQLKPLSCVSTLNLSQTMVQLLPASVVAVGRDIGVHYFEERKPGKPGKPRGYALSTNEALPRQ